jgi:putative peptidoglycan lipid II flippase
MSNLRSRIDGIASSSPLRRLGYATLIAAFTSVAARGFGFLKEIVVASAFGLSDGLDVYLMAFVVVGFPLSVIINALQSVLIPALASSADSNDQQLRLYFSTSAAILPVLLFILLLWLFFLHHALPWIASGFAPDKLQLLERALWWLIPYYFLNALNLLAYGVLQARNRFVLNGLLPIATPVITMTLVLLFAGMGDWQILVGGLVAGTAVEFIVLNLVLYRKQYATASSRNSVSLRHMFQGAFFLMPGTLFAALAPLVEQSVAASLEEGTNAALGYAYRLPAALNSVLVTAIGITVLPYVAKLLEEGKARYCLHSLHRLTAVMIVVGVPFAAILAIFSNEIVSLFYQRGAFDQAAAARVSPIQQVYFFQLPFALVSMLCVRTLIAVKRTGVVSTLTGFVAVIQMGMAIWLGEMIGAVGIAWAATLAMALSSVAAYVLSRRFLNRQIA